MRTSKPRESKRIGEPPPEEKLTPRQAEAARLVLKELRFDLGLTQDEFAVALKVTPGFMHKLENGGLEWWRRHLVKAPELLRCHFAVRRAQEDLALDSAAKKAREIVELEVRGDE